MLVNNHSQDGSELYLRRLVKSHRDVQLIENDRNRYFAGGNNQGIRAARGEHVLLLNADTLVGYEWLERLLRCGKSDPKIGLVAPHTNAAVGCQMVREPGYRSPKDFFPFSKRWALRHDGAWREVHRLIGFCLLIKKEVIRRVGVLDERFGPGGYEDYDYCLRVHQAGYRLALAEDVFLHHFAGKGYVNMDYDGLRRVNREILARKWCGYIIDTLDELDSFLEKDATAVFLKRAGPARSWGSAPKPSAKGS